MTVLAAFEVALAAAHPERADAAWRRLESAAAALARHVRSLETQAAAARDAQSRLVALETRVLALEGGCVSAGLFAGVDGADGGDLTYGDGPLSEGANGPSGGGACGNRGNGANGPTGEG